MRAMKDSNLAKEHHGDPTSFTLGHLGTKLDKQRFDITPA